MSIISSNSVSLRQHSLVGLHKCVLESKSFFNRQTYEYLRWSDKYQKSDKKFDNIATKLSPILKYQIEVFYDWGGSTLSTLHDIEIKVDARIYQCFSEEEKIILIRHKILKELIYIKGVHSTKDLIKYKLTNNPSADFSIKDLVYDLDLNDPNISH